MDDRTQIGVSSLSEKGVQLDVTFYLNTSTAADERRVNNAVFVQMLAQADSLQLPLGLTPPLVGDTGPDTRRLGPKSPEAGAIPSPQMLRQAKPR